jgi:hypothetical protein
LYGGLVVNNDDYVLCLLIVSGIWCYLWTFKAFLGLPC